MAKDKLTDYDSTASGNLDVGGISVAEGMLPSGVNNAIREQMSHLADFAAGTSGVEVLKLQDDTDTNSIKLQAPASVTATTTFTLPDGDGASGQAMITDGAGTLSWAAPYGNRNLIINGAMQVAQRGTSFTPSGVTYCLDRFAHYASSPPSNAVQQSTDVPTGEGFEYSLFMDTIDLRHAVELTAAGKAGVFYSGQKLTLSFWAKTGTSTHSPTINLQFIDGAAFGNVSSAFSSSNNSIVITDSWQRFSIQYTVDTTPTASHYACGFSIGGSANILYITGIQLELGDTATPFEHRSYGDELARCQRYYQRSQTYHYIARGYAAEGYLNLLFPVEMRANPTLTTVVNSAVTGNSISAVSTGIRGYIQSAWTNSPALNSWTTDAEL